VSKQTRPDLPFHVNACTCTLTRDRQSVLRFIYEVSMNPSNLKYVFIGMLAREQVLKRTFAIDLAKPLTPDPSAAYMYRTDGQHARKTDCTHIIRPRPTRQCKEWTGLEDSILGFQRSRS